MVEHPFRTNPLLAQLVARYIAGTSITELLVSGAFAAVLNDNGALTHAMLHHVRNFTDRVTILEDVVACLRDDNPYRDSLLELIPEIKHCTALRNKLAHGLFTSPETGGEVEMITWMTSKQRKTHVETLTTKFLEAELERVGKLNEALVSAGIGSFSHITAKMEPSK